MGFHDTSQPASPHSDDEEFTGFDFPQQRDTFHLDEDEDNNYEESVEGTATAAKEDAEIAKVAQLELAKIAKQEEAKAAKLKAARDAKIRAARIAAADAEAARIAEEEAEVAKIAEVEAARAAKAEAEAAKVNAATLRAAKARAVKMEKLRAAQLAAAGMNLDSEDMRDAPDDRRFREKTSRKHQRMDGETSRRH